MVEQLVLNSGYQIFILGLGTWMATDETEFVGALNAALEIGYRHIDTAFAYQNEHIIGKVLKEWFDSGRLKRDDIFITSKLPPWGAENVSKYLNKTLSDLQLDYLDLYLIHVPFAVKETESYTPLMKPDGTPEYNNQSDHLRIWKELEDQVGKGKIRSIGVSNFGQHQIERILNDCRIPPSNLQIEHHVYLQQPDLIKFCKDRNITVTAYAPLGSPGLSKLGKEVPDILHNPVVTKISKKHGKSAAQILIRHIIQKGIIVIPKSVKRERLRENFEAANFKLDEGDMKELNNLDKGLRSFDFEFLFKGVKKHKDYPFLDLKEH